MDLTNIRSLFTLFSGEEYAEKHEPFVNEAIRNVAEMLTEEHLINDTRLDFLAAAKANLQWQRIMAARENMAYTYGGSIPKNAGEPSLKLAASLADDYYELCADLIKPRAFTFSAFSKEDMPDE